MLRNAATRLTPHQVLRGSIFAPDSLAHRLFATVAEANSPKRYGVDPPRYRASTSKGNQRPSGTRGGTPDRYAEPARVRSVSPASEEKRMLRPAVLVKRIQKLMHDGRLDDAVYMVKNVPLDAQDTIVWNVLMSGAMTARRFTLAWQLYVDVRGPPPRHRRTSFTTSFES